MSAAEALSAAVRRRLGPAPEPAASGLISIVVVNRDGADRLRRLLGGLVERTDYPRLELILVDNASKDDSLELARTAAAPFPIAIVANRHNESFADACNQGAAAASGDLLLFLNNDIEPFEPGWLRELLVCLRRSGAGAVAATLLCGDEEHRRRFRYGYGVQHRGLRLREEAGETLGAVLHGWESDPLDELLGEDVESAAIVAACLLTGREAFERAGGFSHSYVYGGEDVDLCFKLRAAGLPVLCSGRSLVIHHPASTRRAAPFERERTRKLANRRLLWERWGPRMRREYELDLRQGKGLWAAAPQRPVDPSGTGDHDAPTARPRGDLEAPGFCLEAAAAATELEALRAALADRGRRCVLLAGDRVEDPVGLNYDVAVHLAGPLRYVPKPGQFNVLWRPGAQQDRDAVPEDSRYDMVVTGEGDRAEHVAELIEARLAERRFPLRIG